MQTAYDSHVRQRPVVRTHGKVELRKGVIVWSRGNDGAQVEEVGVDFIDLSPDPFPDSRVHCGVTWLVDSRVVKKPCPRISSPIMMMLLFLYIRGLVLYQLL